MINQRGCTFARCYCFIPCLLGKHKSELHFRHWANVPSNTRGYPGQIPHMRSPDGTYLASEFNYTLSRKHKGYDTVGYKHYDHDQNAELDHRFMATVRPDWEKDKGYYSERTYESPIFVAERVPRGFLKDSPHVKGVDDAMCESFSSDGRKEHPNAKTQSGTLTFSRANKHSMPT